jgi:hypothetical protein
MVVRTAKGFLAMFEDAKLRFVATSGHELEPEIGPREAPLTLARSKHQVTFPPTDTEQHPTMFDRPFHRCLSRDSAALLIGLGDEPAREPPTFDVELVL